MRILLGIAAVLLLAYTSMFEEITVPNERTRVYLSAALVDNHAITIDAAVKRFGRTTDLAKYKKHYYTDKAPGSSMAGALLYGVVRIFTPKESWSVESIIRLMRLGLMLPFGVLGCILLYRTLALFHIGQTASDLTVLAWILGTAAFHYSTAFYGHQIAAVLLLLSFHLIFRGDKERTALSWKRLITAGAAAGFAGLTEYQSLIPCVLLTAFAVRNHRKSPKLIAGFLVGALPFALIFLAYHKAAFGGFFALPYEHLISKSLQSMHTKGIAGVFLPRPEAIFGSLLSLHRGLLITSPVFFAVPFGLYRMARQQQTAAAVLIGTISVYYLVFIFSAEAWFGGWAFGPRLLVPVMGCAMIPVAFALDALPMESISAALFRGSIAAGILYNQAVHLVFPEPPENALNPIMDLVVPALRAGVLSPNRAAELTGRPGLWTTVIPLFATAIVLGFIFSRGCNAQPRCRCLRNSAVGIAVLSVLIAVIVAVGPVWSKRKTDKFIHWMTDMQRREFPQQ